MHQEMASAAMPAQRTRSSLLYWLLRRSFFALLAVFSLAMTAAGLAWLLEIDLAFEDDYAVVIRDFASQNRRSELRFPEAEWSPLRPAPNPRDEFDLTASALSIVEQEISTQLEEEPGNTRLLLLRAQIHLLYLQPTPAIDILNRLRPFHQQDPDLLGALGYAHFLRGQQENSQQERLRAIDFFTQALGQRANDGVLLFNAAVACQRARKPREAAVYYRQLIALEPGSPWAQEAQRRLRDLSSDQRK